jgi:hypothetical protein
LPVNATQLTFLALEVVVVAETPVGQNLVAISRAVIAAAEALADIRTVERVVTIPDLDLALPVNFLISEELAFCDYA